MTRKMQVALKVSDEILVLAGCVWCDACECWVWKPTYVNPKYHKHAPAA